MECVICIPELPGSLLGLQMTLDDLERDAEVESEVLLAYCFAPSLQFFFFFINPG